MQMLFAMGLDGSSQRGARRRSPAAGRRPMVRFSTKPSVVHFWADSPPCLLGPHCSVRPMSFSTFLCPTSILKNARASQVASKTLPTALTEGGFTSPQPASTPPHVAQDSESWHIVRKRGWWRAERRARLNSSSNVVPERKRKFFEKSFGRCFNCLARDHRRAQCRDPVRCWKCKASGHYSFSCCNLPSQKSLPSTREQEQPPTTRASAQRPQHSTPIPADPPRRHSGAGPAMERKLSFGSVVSQPQGPREA